MNILHLLSISTLVSLPLTALADNDTPVDKLQPSGTLPTIYINTENNAPIVSKEEYLTATIYMETNGIEGIAGLASKEEPATLQIRGRGNSSWQFDKKPYKLKLDKKASPFGWEKSKHYVLLNHAPTQMYLHEATCFELAKYIDMGWVPKNSPVEVVLNGDYIGVYDFSENIRIDNGRLDINEQPDNNTDPATIGDGWLVELDNTEDTPQISVPQWYEPTGDTPETALITMKTPESLSDLQTKWITDEMTAITKSIYNPDKTDLTWTEYLDEETLAKYYIIQELTCNLDAYVGSTYFYHTQDGKWMSGPIWDSGWTFDGYTRKDTFIKERLELTGIPGRHVWIAELWKFPHFRNRVIEEWKKFYPEKFNLIYGFVDNFYTRTKDAYAVNSLRWPEYDSYKYADAYNTLKNQLTNYAKWFDNYLDRWSSVSNVMAEVGFNVSPDGTVTLNGTAGHTASVVNFQGMTLAQTVLDGNGQGSLTLPAKGMYILTIADLQGRRKSYKLAF